jgi:hypothetical protein
MSSLYAHIYEAHDQALSAREAAAANTAEREAKRQLLDTSYEELAELPALSSFLRIREAAEEASNSTGASNQTDEDDSSNLQKEQNRDGFDRMRRCRMALDALDQVSYFIMSFVSSLACSFEPGEKRDCV